MSFTSWSNARASSAGEMRRPSPATRSIRAPRASSGSRSSTPASRLLDAGRVAPLGEQRFDLDEVAEAVDMVELDRDTRLPRVGSRLLLLLQERTVTHVVEERPGRAGRGGRQLDLLARLDAVL